MGVVIGVIVGYALGSRAGSDGWSELEEAWHTICASEEVRDFIAGGLSIARDVIERRAEVLAEILGVTDERSKLEQAA